MHAIPNGTPPAPLFDEKSQLNTFICMPPIFSPEDELETGLYIGGSEVRILWIAPITMAECNLIIEKGALALMDLLDDNDFSPVIDGDRDSYI